jgi:membrane protease YdiL (CAAX protease family)
MSHLPVVLTTPTASRSSALVVSLYGVAIAVAEACFAFVDVVAGTLADAVLVVVLLNHYIVARRESRGPAVDVLLALSLVPLLRVLSVTMTVEEVPEVYRYGVVGAAVLLAVVLAARLMEAPSLIGLLWPWSWLQAPIALTGLPLGLAAYAIVRPDPLFEGTSWSQILLGSAILLVFTGLTEELMFRGVLNGTLSLAFGRAGLLGSALLFAVVYLGVTPVSYIGFMAALGLGFAVLVDRTGSLVGVGIAHGLLNVGLILVWPAVLG